MTTVKLEFFNDEGQPTGEPQMITTTGDSTYVFDDIGNHIHEDGDFSNVPKGTKKIVATIDCDM